MPTIMSLAPSDLQFDTENPRLSSPNTDQRGTLRAIAEQQGRKLVKLATHIAAHGLSPAEFLLVAPVKGEQRRYRVLEGNRRLAAIRALESPDSLVGTVDRVSLEELRTASRGYLESPIDQIQCAVMKDRDEADPWIELRHTGENAGAGLVKWGSDESSRFKARRGVEPLELQALNLLERANALSTEDRRRVPAASLGRLLGTPEVRASCGLDIRDGKLVLVAAQTQVVKALSHIVRDLASRATKTAHIYTKEQRQAYAASLPRTIALATPAAKGQAARAAPGGAGGKAPKTTRPASPRDVLIPNSCGLGVADARTSAIVAELRILKLSSHPNAISVLFRVFLELSCDHHIESRKLKATVHDRLDTKLGTVLKDLLARQQLSQQQAKPVRTACQRGSALAATVGTLHDYVHNRHVFPATSDLRATWDSLQPFIVAIWPP